jgi:flavin reductase (DIM6/NTAB) family NADH-FMN oxidoreductase RutF
MRQERAPSQLDFDLRFAMRSMASAVSLISCRTACGDRFVMPATSVTSVCLEPPSMLVCVNRTSSTYPALASGVDFSISVLGAAQAEIARNCTGGAMEERFGVGRWCEDETGVPYLIDALVAVTCRQDRRIAHGSHDIIIGEVRSVKVNRISDPLIYADGIYQRLSGQVL